MDPPRSVKEVQHLTGRLIALNQFTSCLREHTLYFLKKLRNIAYFEQTSDYQKAFKEFQIHLSSPKILSQPKENESLFLYLGMLDSTMSIVLVREDEGIQRPVYYFSQTLYNVETRYLKVKKLVFTLVNTSKKLKLYFQAHQVIVLTDQLMRQILYKLKISGHLVR